MDFPGIKTATPAFWHPDRLRPESWMSTFASAVASVWAPTHHFGLLAPGTGGVGLLAGPREWARGQGATVRVNAEGITPGCK